jgi:hypothetical protein
MCLGRAGSRVASTRNLPGQPKSRDLLLRDKNLGFLVESKPENALGKVSENCRAFLPKSRSDYTTANSVESTGK